MFDNSKSPISLIVIVKIKPCYLTHQANKKVGKAGVQVQAAVLVVENVNT